MLVYQRVTWILSNFHTIHGVLCFLLGRIQDSVNKDDGGWRVEQLELLPSGIGHPNGFYAHLPPPKKETNLRLKESRWPKVKGQVLNLTQFLNHPNSRAASLLFMVVELAMPKTAWKFGNAKIHEFDYSWLFIDLSCTLFSCLILFVCWCPHEAQFVQKPGCIPTMFWHSSPMPTMSPTPLTILGDHNSFHSLGTSKALGLVGGLWFSKQTITIWEALGSSTKWFRVDNPLLFGWGTPLIDQSNVRLSHYLRWQVETPTRFKDMFFLWGNGDWTKPFCIHIGLSESRAPLNPQWGWYAQLSSLFRDPYREN